MYLLTRIYNYYKIKIFEIIENSLKLDPRSTSFAIASAICIGTTPLFGFTFFIAVTFGFIFRLNQFILIAVHLLVSPLQIILIYPFIRLGQLIFRLELKSVLPVKQLPGFIINHTDIFISDYLKVMIAATIVWIIVSMIVGYIIYRILLFYFTIYSLTTNN